jgi:predicted ATPase
MCHENFYLEFGPHCTFINGTNGSGKSAILQGLQFCLGMQAAQTGRARAIRRTAYLPCAPTLCRQAQWAENECIPCLSGWSYV